jgi:hypothetical protein
MLTYADACAAHAGFLFGGYSNGLPFYHNELTGQSVWLLSFRIYHSTGAAHILYMYIIYISIYILHMYIIYTYRYVYLYICYMYILLMYIYLSIHISYVYIIYIYRGVWGHIYSSASTMRTHKFMCVCVRERERERES